MARELPILMTGWSVRGILDGRKTQTRRPVKPQPPSVESVREDCGARFGLCQPIHPPGRDWRVSGPVHSVRRLMGREPRWLCPYGQPGGLLWVRETFYCDDYRYPHGPRDELLRLMEYRADHDCRAWEAGCPCADEDGRGLWRPSIHMPKWAARIWLRVTDVRVERVQDIGTEDVIAEGLSTQLREHDAVCHLREQWEKAWESLHGGKDGLSWADSPWVWVISFEPTDPPRDGRG